MWVLIIFIYAGGMTDHEAVTTASVPGFTSQAKCEAAATKVKPFVRGTTKNIETACVLQ